MFLDPEPRTARRPHSSTSTFSPPQTPTHPPQDQRIKRKPLQERSRNQTRRQLEPTEPAESELKQTVRLVRQSPSVKSVRKENPNDGDDISREKGKHKLFQHSSQTEKGRGVSHSKPAALRVSDLHSPSNEGQKLNTPPTLSLPSPTFLPLDIEPWHRRDVSSGNYSNSSTLKDNDAADPSFIQSDAGTSARFSSGTTLRLTPTPYEKELCDLVESAEEAGLSSQDPARAPEALEETGTPTQYTPTAPPESDLQSNTVVRPNILDRIPHIPPRTSSNRVSAASFDVFLNNLGTVNPSPSYPPANPRQSIADSEVSSPPRISLENSPYFVAYSSPLYRPRSRSHPLRGERSYESIESRLQSANLRPATQHSLAQSNSWGSLRPSSSIDTLPSIHVPKKRFRHQGAAHSLDSKAPSRDPGSGSMDPDIDTQPFPRQTFSNHLSTIASESDKTGSRAASQQLSHFSFGSGVLTGDEASSRPLSAAWPAGHYRRHSDGQTLSSESLTPFGLASHASGISEQDEEVEAGDMTLGLYREQSAKPEPLLPRRSSAGFVGNKIYDGPLPPLPALHESGEHLDMLAELARPNVRPKRSGYSLRHQRSNTALGHSRHVSLVSCNESERWSSGSSIFPTWAKHFYAGDAAFASVSRLSLSSPSAPQTRDGPPVAVILQRQPSFPNASTRLGIKRNDPPSISPESSRFIPQIFRPRTRPHETRKEIAHSSLNVPSPNTRPSRETDDRPDSLAIMSAPLSSDSSEAILPSGQSKYGPLNDQPKDAPRPLPRTYSQNKHWDEMTFPRPMSKDRLSAVLQPQPRLAPQRRSSIDHNAWRPPSFVESLDVLFKSSGHRQITFFLLGFFCPLCWMLGAVLPLPPHPSNQDKTEKGMSQGEESPTTALNRHEVGDAAARWREEKAWKQGRWWRTVNRVMSFVGFLVIAAVIAIAVVTTR